MSASLRLEVLLASTASGLAIASSLANSSRLAFRSSKIASMITSAFAAPAPATSGISRSIASRTRAGSRSRRLNSFAARSTAGARRSGEVSCSVTVMPRIAQIAAMSPPITPAPITCTCRALKSTPLARPFIFSCRKKMRIRLRVVGCSVSAFSEQVGSSLQANVSPSYCCQAFRIAYGAG